MGGDSFPVDDLKSEIYVDQKIIYKWYKRIMIGSILLLIALLFVPEKTYFAVLLITFPVYGFFYTLYFFLMKKNCAHLKAYSNGMVFKGLGFYSWDDISGVFADNHLFFSIDLKGNEIPPKKGVGADLFYFDEKSKCLAVKFSFPKRVSNKSLKEFFLQIVDYLPKQKIDNEAEKEVEEEKKITWRSRLFQKEDIETHDWAMLVLSLTALYFLFYAIEKPYFFPSIAWVQASTIIIVVLTCVAILKSLHTYFYKPLTLKINFWKQSSLTRVILLFLIPAFFYFSLYMTIQIGTGHVLTSAVGKKRQIVVSFYKDDKLEDNCLGSNELKVGLFRELCVKEAFYKEQPDKFKLNVDIKQSWFGIAIKHPEKDYTSKFKKEE